MPDFLKQIFGGNKNAKAKKLYFNAIAIDDANPGEFIRIVPVGVFPMHHNGGHEVTAEHIDEMAANFTAKSTDLLVDWEHNSLWGDTKAAGWITELEAREDGLYAKYPEFTPGAEEQIANREYRYFSPVYKLESTSKSGESRGAVIDSVAITNRPYFDEDEINAIGNSAAFSTGADESDSDESGNLSKNKTTADMKLNKENLAKFGLDENATEEEVNAAIANSNVSAEAPEGGEGEKGKGKGEKPVVNSDEPENELAAKVNSLEEKLTKQEEAAKAEKAEQLVNSAINDGKILPAQKKAYMTYANSDFEGCKEELDGIKVNAAKPNGVHVSTSTKGEDGKKVNSTEAAANVLRDKINATKAARA